MMSDVVGQAGRDAFEVGLALTWPGGMGAGLASMQRDLGVLDAAVAGALAEVPASIERLGGFGRPVAAPRLGAADRIGDAGPAGSAWPGDGVAEPVPVLLTMQSARSEAVGYAGAQNARSGIVGAPAVLGLQRSGPSGDPGDRSRGGVAGGGQMTARSRRMGASDGSRAGGPMAPVILTPNGLAAPGRGYGEAGWGEPDVGPGRSGGEGNGAGNDGVETARLVTVAIAPVTRADIGSAGLGRDGSGIGRAGRLGDLGVQSGSNIARAYEAVPGSRGASAGRGPGLAGGQASMRVGGRGIGGVRGGGGRLGGGDGRPGGWLGSESEMPGASQRMVGRPAMAPQMEAGEGGAGGGGPVLLDGRLVGQWLSERMGRDASRPGAGATFFDARQGPAWVPSGS